MNNDYKRIKKKKDIFEKFSNNFTLNENEENVEYMNTFTALANNFIGSFQNGNFQQARNFVNQMRDLAHDMSKSLLPVFVNLNLAEFLIKFLDVDESSDTLSCISVCLAHEDEISFLFLESGFLSIAHRNLVDQNNIIPTLASLSNIAASSTRNITLIMNEIPSEVFLNLYQNYINDEAFMNKFSRLLMNFALLSPVPQPIIECLIQMYDSPFEEVKINALWGSHYAFSRATDLTGVPTNLIELYISLVKNENEKIKYIGCLLITDIIKFIPENLLHSINLSMLLSSLNSSNPTIVKAALVCISELIRRNRRWVDDNYFDECLKIIGSSPFKIKRDVSEVFLSSISNCPPLDCKILINKGLFQLLNELLSMDDMEILKGVLTVLTHIIYASEHIIIEENVMQQNVVDFVKNDDLIHQISILIDKFDNESLHYKYDLFLTAFNSLVHANHSPTS